MQAVSHLAPTFRIPKAPKVQVARQTSRTPKNPWSKKQSPQARPQMAPPPPPPIPSQLHSRACSMGCVPYRAQGSRLYSCFRAFESETETRFSFLSHKHFSLALSNNNVPTCADCQGHCQKNDMFKNKSVLFAITQHVGVLPRHLQAVLCCQWSAWMVCVSHSSHKRVPFCHSLQSGRPTLSPCTGRTGLPALAQNGY